MRKALILFVRNPQLGKVKTRLAAQIGDQKALLIYKKLLKHTRSIALEAACTPYVFVTEHLNDDTWNDFQEENQIEGDLGERMLYAFEYLFKKGYERVVIIGSDCPGLLSYHINDAFDRLEKHDAVLGPANDGGYYLLGLKKLYKSLFENKSWSTSSVLNDTIETMEQHNLSYYLLETLTDVDEEKDLPELWKKEFCLPT